MPWVVKNKGQRWISKNKHQIILSFVKIQSKGCVKWKIFYSSPDIFTSHLSNNFKDELNHVFNSSLFRGNKQFKIFQSYCNLCDIWAIPNPTYPLHTPFKLTTILSYALPKKSTRSDSRRPHNLCKQSVLNCQLPIGTGMQLIKTVTLFRFCRTAVIKLIRNMSMWEHQNLCVKIITLCHGP